MCSMEICETWHEICRIQLGPFTLIEVYTHNNIASYCSKKCIFIGMAVCSPVEFSNVY